ncbi:hypothetical protein ACWEPL_40185 [Nonomuraea sp. NPDC004186]
MRKIVAELFSSLDGVVGSPDRWHGPFHGLADRMNELRLLIDPVVVREGRKLFEDDGDRLTCTLLASHSYRTGTVSATYAVAG